MAQNQPSNIEPYLQPGNQASRNPLEQKITEKLHSHENVTTSNTTASTGQSKPQDGVPTSRGLGVHGSGPVDDQEARATSTSRSADQPENENVNAEQMATLAEGKVADAVHNKSGTQQVPGSGPAEEQDFASDLDRLVLHEPSYDIHADIFPERRPSRQRPARRSRRPSVMVWISMAALAGNHGRWETSPWRMRNV